MVKNLPAMQETPVSSLGKKHPLEREVATHSSILAGKIQREAWWSIVHRVAKNPMDRSAWWATVHRVAKSQTQLSTLHNHWTTREFPIMVT